MARLPSSDTIKALVRGAGMFAWHLKNRTFSMNESNAGRSQDQFAQCSGLHHAVQHHQLLATG